MKIMFKLILAFLLMTFLLGFVGYVGLKNIGIVYESFGSVSGQTVPITNSLNEMRVSALSVFAATAEILLYAGNGTIDSGIRAHELEELAESKEKFNSTFKEYDSLVTQYFPGEVGTKDSIGRKWGAFVGKSDEILQFAGRGIDNEDLFRVQKEFEEAKEVLLEAVEKALAHESEEFALGQEAVGAVVNRSLSEILVTIWLFVLLSVVGITITYGISTSVIKLKSAAERLGKGDLGVRVELASKDELGELAATFNQMSEDIKKSHGEALMRAKEAEEAKKELEDKVEELERFSKLTVGRELKMIELKKRIKELEGKK